MAVVAHDVISVAGRAARIGAGPRSGTHWTEQQLGQTPSALYPATLCKGAASCLSLSENFVPLTLHFRQTHDKACELRKPAMLPRNKLEEKLHTLTLRIPVISWGATLIGRDSGPKSCLFMTRRLNFN